MQVTLTLPAPDLNRPVTHDTTANGLYGCGHGGILVPMTATETELHPCACGDPECREMTRATYARGHAMKARKFNNPQPDLLPGPDDDLDLGILDLDGGAPMAGPELREDAPPSPEPSPPLPPDDDDEPVRPLGFPAGPKGKPGKAARGPVRVTTAMRKDIHAKIQMPLFIIGKVWEVRDPWCGGTWMQQLPATTDAFTSIVCDSPDLVAFFTGPGGGFMKYLELGSALAPVGMMWWQHHIAHAIGGPESNGQPQPDMAQYAA